MSVALAFASIALAHPYADDAVQAIHPNCDQQGAAWLTAARAYTEEGREQQALEAITEAQRCGGEPQVISAHRALVAAALDEPSRALPMLDDALRENPEHLGLRAERARILAALGFDEAASEDWSFVMARTARPQPDQVLLWSEALSRAGDLRRALDVLDDAIERVGPAPALVLRALDVEIALGWTTAALGRLDGLPDRSPWRERRASLLVYTEGASTTP